MVRRSNDLNAKILGQPIGNLIGAGHSKDWAIDWGRFFELSHQHHPQMARRIGPSYDYFFATESKIGIDIKHGKRTNDLALQDLTRSIDAGLLRVKEVITEIKAPFSDVTGSEKWHIWDDACVSDLMQEWASSQYDKGKRFPGHAVSDPPFAAFVLIEAGKSGTDRGFGDGRTLGCIGSIMTAEVLFSAILNARNYLDYVEESGDAQLSQTTATVLGNESITTMPDLIKFISRNSR